VTPSSPGWTVLTLVCAISCSSWPRYAHLPDEGGLVGPNQLEGLAWSELGQEVESNDWPNDPGISPTELAIGDALTLSGVLDGTGYAGGAPEERFELGCANAPARRYPLVDGEYTGDVDAVVVVAAAPGVLCATVQLDVDVAFDMLLLPLDDCDLPGQPVSTADGVLGQDRGGGGASWASELESGSYAVQLAAWDPSDPGRAVPWELAIALTEGDCSALGDAP
jgi:hypothetical protein